MAASSGLIKVRVCGQTDVGCVRTNNEDNLLIVDLTNGYTPLATEEIARPLAENRILFAVADGMGGAAAGEVASTIAVDKLREEFLHFQSSGTSERLVHAIEQINNQILTEGQRQRQYKGMATTLTAALIEGDRAYIAEVGDSRAYIVRGGKIKQITTDQSWLELLIEQGLLSREAAKESPQRNVILQSLGGQQNVKVALTAVTLAAGDWLVLCSDGLSEKLSAAEIMACLSGQRPGNAALERACQQMVQLARQRGGDDNITVIAAHFNGDGLQASPLAEELISHIEVISVFDPVVETGVRETRKLSAELRGKANFNTTINVDNQPGGYPEQQQLLEQSQALLEYVENVELAMEQQLLDLDKFGEWQLRRCQLDLSLQQSIAALRAVAPVLAKLKAELLDCDKQLQRCAHNPTRPLS